MPRDTDSMSLLILKITREPGNITNGTGFIMKGLCFVPPATMDMITGKVIAVELTKIFPIMKNTIQIGL